MAVGTIQNVDITPDKVLVHLYFDEVEKPHSFQLEVIQKVNTLRSRGKSMSKTVYSKDIVVDRYNETTVEILKEDLEVYTYNGKEISMITYLSLRKKKGIVSFLFSPDKEEIHLGKVNHKNSDQNKAKLLIDAPDQFDLFKNVEALSDKNQNVFFFNIGLFAMISICIFYLAYQFSTVFGWIGAVAAHIGLYFLVKLYLGRLMKKYMIFGFVNKKGEMQRGKTHFLSNLIGGIPRVDLKNCELRIVACNIELGQYETGSGKSKRTVSFEEPIKCILLHKEILPDIPSGRKLENIIKSKISFDQVYEHLAPTCMTSNSHGLKLHWEIQILHPEFKDQELVGSNDGFYFSHFRLGYPS